MNTDRNWMTVLPGEVTEEYLVKNNLLVCKGACAWYLFTDTYNNRRIVDRWRKEHET